MSADNGVYILVTKGPEYRVAHLGAVENVWWDESAKDMAYGDSENGIKNAREMWAGAMMFTDKLAALDYAERVWAELPVCEYGISFVVLDEPFDA